ncbi:DUF803-domain-containing protein [Rhizodiscina lignyota]|uniref:DUF803-domain-containing protein n=1 Tax=Rhizodiscina lignyota TaxID=1504668 RepID=A0A9P4IKG5_9PEZI|nr:DUF803-domain-containing protein [Rhizodiscina lignyota]
MDHVGRNIVLAHELYTRANSTTNTDDPHNNRPPIYKVIGIILAVSSGLFIGVSFVLKKIGLLKANEKYNEEAGEGYGYLKNAFWWTGMTLMIIGEICNFVAYAFVDAILVTPLGALSVVVTTILSAIFLKERLSFVGKVGCFNCIIGSVVIVINAPEQSAVATIQDMKKLVITPGFLTYAGVIIVGCVFVALWVAPRYGKKSMLVYLSICSLIGGLSVVCTQGLGAAIVAQVSGTPQFNQWFLYIVLVFVITTLVTEIIYLNVTLNLFNAALVTPTYYVFFTSATIVTSAVLFQGFKGTAATITTVVMGFLQICAGVILLQLSKSAKDVPDAAVFTGDLDQVRTVAEQEEPEYEPRADTIRGGGALLRSISRMRTKRQQEEAKRLHDERMTPIGENEHVEWDGLRRRKTVVESGHGPVPQRSKTIHPPLGMSHFPDDDDDRESQVSDMHPGIFPWRRRSRNASNAARDPSVPLSPMKAGGNTAEASQPHTFGLPVGLQPGNVDGGADTSYHGVSQHIQFEDGAEEARAKSAASSNTLVPPRPPPHSAKRQFSFQNVFSRRRASSGDDDSLRPDSSGSRGVSRLSFNRKNSQNQTRTATEEESLGLVKGDSRNLLVREEYESPSPPNYSDVEDDWQGYEGGRQSSLPGPLAPGGLGYVREESPEQGSSSQKGSHKLPPLPFENDGPSDPSRGGRRNDHDDTDNDATPK